jgi:hypothetical protein
MKRNLRAAAFALAAGLALLGVGCAHMTVNKLMAEPARYRNQEVTLKGDVVKSLGVLGHGVYQLDDGTGTIWVYSTHGMPRQGAHVKVSGRVTDVVDLGGVIPLPREVGSGLVMDQTHIKGSY